jgi:uncharacterized protein involved in response to NO
MTIVEKSDPGETRQTRQTWGGERRQNHLYQPFLRGALVTALTAGATLGALNLAVMGFRADLSAVWGPLIQAHGYAQMFGWVGLFIMGVAYHTLPRFYLRPLARPEFVAPAFALVAASLALRFVTQPLAGVTGVGAVLAWLVPVSAALGLAGVTLFVAAMYDTMRHGADRFGGSASGLFIGAGFVWLWLAAALTLVLTAALPARGLDMIAPAWDAPYLRATLSGALVTIILGFTLRTMPHMLGLRPPGARTMRAIFAGYTVAVGAQVAAQVAAALDPATPAGGASWAGALALLGAGGEIVSLLAFVAAVGLFKVSALRATPLARRNPWPERFIRTAYGWLLGSSALNLTFATGAGGTAPHAFMASYHHALTVGFISTMIVGMSMRLVPVFIGAMNRQTRLAGAIYTLLVVGAGARVAGQSLAFLYGGPFYTLMGASGFVEVCALSGFAVALWRALARPSYGQTPAGLRAQVVARSESG